jgi:hypothetical protein
MAVFNNILRQRIAEHYEKTSDEVLSGLSPDLYVRQIGYLQALKDVIKFIEEIEKSGE